MKRSRKRSVSKTMNQELVIVERLPKWKISQEGILHIQGFPPGSRKKSSYNKRLDVLNMSETYANETQSGHCKVNANGVGVAGRRVMVDPLERYDTITEGPPPGRASQRKLSLTPSSRCAALVAQARATNVHNVALRADRVFALR